MSSLDSGHSGAGGMTVSEKQAVDRTFPGSRANREYFPAGRSLFNTDLLTYSLSRHE